MFAECQLTLFFCRTMRYAEDWMTTTREACRTNTSVRSSMHVPNSRSWLATFTICARHAPFPACTTLPTLPSSRRHSMSTSRLILRALSSLTISGNHQARRRLGSSACWQKSSRRLTFNSASLLNECRRLTTTT